MTLSETVVKLINSITQVDAVICRGGSTCPSNVITAMINECQNNSPIWISKEFDFIRQVIIVQEDGRNCSASDKINNIKKLLSDDWRFDIEIVTAGLQRGVIRIDELDLIRLNSH